MKVIHVISGGDSGGAKTHLLALAQGLSEHIDFKIVCFIAGDFYDTALKLGLPVVLIEQKNRLEVFSSKRFIEFINEEKPDIIHAHGARANFFVYLNRFKIKIPLLTTIHSDYNLDFKDNLYKYLLFTSLNKISLRHFNYYVAVSPDFKNMLIRRGYKADKIYSVYNGIDFHVAMELSVREVFAKKYGLEAELGKHWVGIISRLEIVKGVDVFIRGAKLILEKDPNVHFLIAGDGSQRAKLTKLASELGISEHICFLGYISDVNSLLNALEINTVTSHSESFTYALLEGARLRKASVASRVGGLPDLIKDGETGLLFEDSDPVDFAVSVISYLTNEELRKRLGENLYRHSLENFSIESMARTHIQIYDEVVERYDKKNK